MYINNDHFLDTNDPLWPTPSVISSNENVWYMVQLHQNFAAINKMVAGTQNLEGSGVSVGYNALLYFLFLFLF